MSSFFSAFKITKTFIMKAKLILLVVVVTLLSSCATVQYSDPIKVAITEVIDPSGEVADGSKAFIRSALTDAITNSEGYEGYAQISFFSLDANFSKTGNISIETLTYVKKQMMDYILVSKIHYLSKSKVLLTAQIIRSSDGKIVSSSSEETYPHIDYLRSACNNLAYKLVGAI